MIPADAPPSLDGHRENTFATVHSTAPFYSVADPSQSRQSVVDDRLRLRSLHRDAEADRRRQDLHLQDPQGREVPRRHAAHRRRRGGELAAHRRIRPRACRARARAYYRRWSTRSRAPDPETVVFKLKFATARLPAGARRSVRLHLQEGDRSTRTRTGTRRTSWAPARSSSSAYEIGQSIKGERNPDYYHEGQPYLDGFTAHLRRQAGGPRRRHPRRPRRDRVPRHAAVGARRAGQGARRQDHGAGPATGTAST